MPSIASASAVPPSTICGMLLHSHSLDGLRGCASHWAAIHAYAWCAKWLCSKGIRLDELRCIDAVLHTRGDHELCHMMCHMSGKSEQGVPGNSSTAHIPRWAAWSACDCRVETAALL